MASKKPPDRIWLRSGTAAVLPLSEVEIETIGVGDALEYIRADLVATAMATERESVWAEAIELVRDTNETLYDHRGNVPKPAAVFKQNAIAVLEAAKKAIRNQSGEIS